ncbi:MAG: hypothetical protein EPO68_09460 [Planctomycetota bacterium]|nr:MAG: hypothetical protein EPO68_09460 [Planctomycetota bacterium]
MHLKPLDLLVAIQLAIAEQPPSGYEELGKAVGLSASEAHKAVRRGVAAGLLRIGANRADKPSANTQTLLSFLKHGAPHAFFATPGRVVRGVPTAHSAAPLNQLVQSDGDLPFVWPAPEGTTRGRAIEPLYRTVPSLVATNPKLCEALALVDALRCGRARERDLAYQELEKRLHDAEPD